METNRVEWYNGQDVTIFFCGTPHLATRIILPSMTITEKNSIIKYPFTNKRILIVTLFDHRKLKKYEFTIPKGYCWDGATIPKMFWRIIGSNTDNTFLVPSLIHDFMCEHHEIVDNDVQFSTIVFDALLEQAGVPKFKRFMMRNSVGLFQKIWGKW